MLLCYHRGISTLVLFIVQVHMTTAVPAVVVIKIVKVKVHVIYQYNVYVNLHYRTKL